MKEVIREEVYNYHIQECSECTPEDIVDMVDDVMNGDYEKWFDEVFCGKRSMNYYILHQQLKQIK